LYLSGQAFDADLGKNANLTYTLAGGNKRNLLALDAHTGSLRVNKPLSSIDFDDLLLSIVAKDGGVPSLSSSTELRVVISKDIAFPAAYARGGSSYRQSILANEGTVIVLAVAFAAILVAITVITAVIILARTNHHRRDGTKPAMITSYCGPAGTERPNPLKEDKGGRGGHKDASSPKVGGKTRLTNGGKHASMCIRTNGSLLCAENGCVTNGRELKLDVVTPWSGGFGNGRKDFDDVIENQNVYIKRVDTETARKVSIVSIPKNMCVVVQLYNRTYIFIPGDSHGDSPIMYQGFPTIL